VQFLPLIEAKREGRALAPDQISEVVRAFVAGEIPDYQMAAFLMAVCFRGLDPVETRTLTLSMRDSGEVIRLPDDSRPIVDKHSTGGVGDKVSLPLAPLLACLGFRVPMISGRGLGITGGTLDKLDSIPGFQTLLPSAKIIEVVQETGCVICGQTDHMVPADKKLYALRDVTATVPSIPLIVSSILSKKLAEGLDALVLDVKFGSAAFMTTLDRARELAGAMVGLGRECGVNTRALLTSMDVPLGRSAGNWLEVRESVECLENRGPEDLRELVIDCAAHLLMQTGKATSAADGRALASTCLASGAPRRKWDEMLCAQGADPVVVKAKLALTTTAKALVEIKAPSGGFVTACDARAVGEAVRDLEAGRLRQDSQINYDNGVDALVKPGERVAKGDLLARVHGSTKEAAKAGAARIAAAIKIGDKPGPIPPLVREVIS
jgi:pyrimidine-nucleoside phosphorylase